LPQGLQTLGRRKRNHCANRPKTSEKRRLDEREHISVGVAKLLLNSALWLGRALWQSVTLWYAVYVSHQTHGFSDAIGNDVYRPLGTNNVAGRGVPGVRRSIVVCRHWRWIDHRRRTMMVVRLVPSTSNDLETARFERCHCSSAPANWFAKTYQQTPIDYGAERSECCDWLWAVVRS